MTGDPVRLGVVGVGAITLRGILPHLALDDVHDRVRVEALCDPVLDRAQAVAADFGIPKTYASIEELVADDEIDAVSIASPISLHYEHCLAALHAGKHVHVNKTMTTTVGEADEVIDLATGNGLRLVPSPGEGLRPQLVRARELIREGAIGSVAWAICGGAAAGYHENEQERSSAPGETSINPGWYFRKPGGGPMYDVTVYALHQLTSVLGPAKRVTGLSGIRVRERTFQGRPLTIDADDNTLLTLDFGDGLFALVHGTAAGAVSSQFGAGIYFGTGGTIDGVLLNGEPFDYPGRDLTAHAPPTDWNAQMCVLPAVIGEHRELPEAHVFQDIMELVEAIRAGRAPRVGCDQARHVIDIIESGYRSSVSGEAQELETSFDVDEAEQPARLDTL